MKLSWLIGVAVAVSLGVSGAALAFDSSSNSNSDSGSNYKAPAANSAEMSKVQAAIQAKDYSGAVALLDKMDAKNADVENLLGFSYRMLGKYPDAFRYYDAALAIDPKHKGALEYEGEAYLETDQLPKAEANLATLKSACGAMGCEEVGMLADAIGHYKAKAKIN
jgi:tetratricopeptide (TPR) repeat protein